MAQAVCNDMTNDDHIRNVGVVERKTKDFQKFIFADSFKKWHRPICNPQMTKK